MTDQTTELRISEPLRGFIRHQSNRAYIDGGQARWLTDIADKIDAKHEQAIAATLGNDGVERSNDGVAELQVENAELGSEPPYDELIRCLENDWNISASWDGLRKFWCIELTEEGVKLRDAVHGTLTAEQVREAIEANSWAETSTIREFNDSSWQAIADELNAELGSDTSAARLAERLRSIADEMRNVGASTMTPHELLACYAHEVDKVADSLKFAATLGSEREKALEELVRDLFDRGKYFNPERYGIKALTKRARNLGIEVNL